MSLPAANRPLLVRFSLRTLFLVVTVLGALLGWIGVQLKWLHNWREALRWVVDPHARQQAMKIRGVVPPRNGHYISNTAAKAPWPLELLGELGVERLEVERPH